MGYLSRKDNATLLAYLNNDDGSVLAEDAKRELMARGALPGWASAPVERPMPDNVSANLAAAATPIAGDSDLRDRDAQNVAFQDAGGRTAMPRPRLDDGSPYPSPREFGTPDEAEKYYTRPRDRNGNLMPSQYDLDRQARGDAAVYNDRGEIVYRRAAPTDAQGKPRSDINPADARYSDFLIGNSAATGETTGNPPPFEVVEHMGPFGPTRVLVPTKASRDRQASRQEAASVARIAARTGRTPEEIQAMSREERAALQTQTAEASAKSRRDRWRAMAQLAGGSHNINSGNRWMFNALMDLPEKERQAALQQMLPMNPARAQVEARQLDMAARLAGDAITGALAGQGAHAYASDARQAQRMDMLRAKAGDAKANAWPGYQRTKAEEALDRAGASWAERDAVMRDLFGPEWQSSPTRGANGSAPPGSGWEPSPVPRDYPTPGTLGEFGFN